jgi:hypothetical protein
MKNSSNCFLIYSLLLLVLCSCSKEDASNLLTIQERLDNGETPWEIHDSENTIHYSFVGKRYGGGKIVSFDQNDGTGLIASNEDLGFAPWGCQGIMVIGLEDITEIDGQLNTDLIISQSCSEGSAAELCANYSNDGFDDWFLPSLPALRKLEVLGSSTKGLYWSSSINRFFSITQDSSVAYSRYINMDESCPVFQDIFTESIMCEVRTERYLSKRVRAFRKYEK